MYGTHQAAAPLTVASSTSQAYAPPRGGQYTASTSVDIKQEIKEEEAASNHTRCKFLAECCTHVTLSPHLVNRGVARFIIGLCCMATVAELQQKWLSLSLRGDCDCETTVCPRNRLLTSDSSAYSLLIAQHDMGSNQCGPMGRLAQAATYASGSRTSCGAGEAGGGK